MSKIVPQYINGEFVAGQSPQQLAVINPANQATLATLPLSSEADIQRAVAGAAEAFKHWRKVAVPERARLMLHYPELLKDHHDELARILAEDNGKTFEDAKGDVWRGIEVVEQACNTPSLLMGETVENVARDVDTYSITQPLGVCVGITPFNFPAMIPLWMFPLAIACGNTFVLKPSEQVPLTALRLVELFEEAGCPPGVLQLVHGGKEQVDALLDHPDTRAISFVGSVPAGEHIYRRGCHQLKRVQCMAGAKNHMVIMPDADKNTVINNLLGAAVGAAGQRCMAISVAVFVGDSIHWLDELCAKLAEIQPGHWDDPAAGFGPLISQTAKQRVTDLIAAGVAEGANLKLDGRDCSVAGYPDGNWLGPTVFSDVSSDMRIYREEIFGPVLCAVHVANLDEALALVNANPYGNGTSIFTASGAAARRYQSEVEVGQVGINIPIPVPLPFFSFTGWKKSFMGDLHAYGKQAIRFYTETKTITARWPDDSASSAQPNMTITLK